jgi:hypothetical protein
MKQGMTCTAYFAEERLPTSKHPAEHIPFQFEGERKKLERCGDEMLTVCVIAFFLQGDILLYAAEESEGDYRLFIQTIQMHTEL